MAVSRLWLKMGLVVASVWACSALTVAAEPPTFALGEKETIVFAGDSITAAGDYVTYVEAYLRTRFPARSFKVVYAGRRSETLSGLTEPKHPGPRPILFERFEKDVAAHRPTWVVACYGMNDGIYHPWSDERFAAYKKGVGELIDRVRALQARLLLLTPPPYDPVTRGPLPEGDSFSFRRPFPDYDDVLARYTAWLLAQRAPDVLVADVHSALRGHLDARRKDTPDFALHRDGIHPLATGHMLMALQVLEAWGAPALVSEAIIDVASGAVVKGDIRHPDGEPGVDVARERPKSPVRRATFLWTAPLPMPIDGDWDPASVALARVHERLNRQPLVVRGLPPGRYVLAQEAWGYFSADQLAAGIDVAAIAEWPTVRASREVLDLVRERQKATAEAALDIERRLRESCAPKTDLILLGGRPR